MTKCSYESCGQQAVAKGLCSGHYQQSRKGKRLKPLSRQHPEPTCVFEDCVRPTYAKSLCDAHYQQQLRGDDLTPLRTAPRAVCSQYGCTNMSSVRGLCGSHHHQIKSGKPLTQIHAPHDHAMRDADGNKFCITCRSWCPENFFSKSSEKPDGLAYACQRCTRDAYRFRRYGLKPGQFEAMIDNQGGLCGLCRNPLGSGKDVHIDHDHACCPDSCKSCGDCVRGILCATCNKGMGHFRDDTNLLRAAADYIERHRK